MKVILKSDETRTPIAVLDSCVSRKGELLLGLDAQKVYLIKGQTGTKGIYWVEDCMVDVVGGD